MVNLYPKCKHLCKIHNHKIVWDTSFLQQYLTTIQMFLTLGLFTLQTWTIEQHSLVNQRNHITFFTPLHLDTSRVPVSQSVNVR